VSLASYSKNVAWVTGGSGDIGDVIVGRLRKEKVRVTSLSSKNFDISNMMEIQEYIRLVSKKNYPDILICNAGINNPELIEKQSISDLEKIVNTNLMGHITLIKAVLPHMAARRFGRIVIISSIYSQRARSGRSAYSLSKSALDSFMRSVAIEYADKGILANSVAPGFIDTKLTSKNNKKKTLSKIITQIPTKRLGTPQEVSELVWFLASKKNTYITGQTISIDGGFSIL